jgi:hypothetical protein
VAGALCPSVAPPPEADYQPMVESDFTQARFDSAFAYFVHLGSILEEPDSISHLVHREGYWLEYDANLLYLDGFNRKQAALLERFELDSTASSGPARARFCDFLAHARWPD